MITEQTLPESCPNCPLNCSFLGVRSFLPDTLPYYCNKYETYLGMDPAGKLLRCAACRLQKRCFVTEGTGYIQAYTGAKALQIAPTKEVFLTLNQTFQRLFCDLISKTGAQIVLSNGGRNGTQEALVDAILSSWKEFSDKAGSPEMQEFKGILSAAAEGFPFFEKQTQTLLMNLFQVLNNSEKEMLKSVLQNAHQIESFLKQFSKTPQDNDLLRNTRALLYDYDRREAQRIRQQQQQMLQRRQEETRRQWQQLQRQDYGRDR